MASSTAATANDALWGSTPIKTFMSAHLRFGRTTVPSAWAKDIPYFGPVHIPLLSHSARRVLYGGTRAENRPTHRRG